MKKVLFSLIVSGFALTNIQPVEAVKSSPLALAKEEAASRQGAAVKPHKAFKEKKDAKPSVDLSRIQWIPQAPVSRIKNEKLYLYWLQQAEQFPDRIKMVGNTPCFAKENGVQPSYEGVQE